MSMPSSFTSMGSWPKACTASVWKTTLASWAAAASSANRLDGADLVVGEHDGGQDGVRADGRLEVLNAHEPVLVHGQVGHFEALALQRLAGVKHRVVLDGARDKVAPLGGVGPGEAP